MFLKNQILEGRNERNTKITSLYPGQIIIDLAQKVLLLLDQKFGILFLLIFSSQKYFKCSKNSSKHETEKYVSAVCAHIMRIIKSYENRKTEVSITINYIYFDITNIIRG